MEKPFELTCEYEINPLGVDATQPRLSWLLTSNERAQIQSAYQVLVSSSKENIDSDFGNKWDSGKVIDSRSVNVTYNGETLTSSEKCFWKVKVWDQNDQSSEWSNFSTFEMGLLQVKDWQAKWIGASQKISSPLLRKEFFIEKSIKQARTYITGLGWYELFLNGQRVGDHVLDPATSDYNKRILYCTYDVTDLLQKGKNTVGVMLGNGWFCEPGWKYKYGDSPMLLMKLDVLLSDNTKTILTSDTDWKVSSGQIVRNDLYGGETYDARLEQAGWTEANFNDTEWESAIVKTSPKGKLVSQLISPIRIKQIIKPVKVTEPKNGIKVFDFGQLFGGWVRLKLKGSSGTKISIKYSPQIYKESELIDQESGEFSHEIKHRDSSYLTDKETDYYIMKGDPICEIYQPRFTYHPVRYVQIEGEGDKFNIEEIEGQVIHSDVNLSGGFNCSNPLLNRIHELVHWTVKNGLLGIPLDCLHREHWAWTDPATVVSSIYPRKHMPNFWIKWLYDIRDAQNKDGSVPDICPNYTQSRSDPAWGSNYPILVWYIYQYFDDIRILEDHYESIKLWVKYLLSISEDHLVNKGHYGDHMLPGKEPGQEEFVSLSTPPPLLWTGYFYRSVIIVSLIADRLGIDKEGKHYKQLAEKIKEALNNKWLNKQTSQYAQGSQTSNLFPLALGIVPKINEASVVKNVVKDITENWDGHLHTGNTGTTCLIDTMTAFGQGETFYTLLTKTSYPGWGFMVDQDATTIWESWSLQSKVGNAESMIMWASIDEFFYNDLAGIKGPDYYGPKEISAGFKEININPYILGDLVNARARMRTVYGMVSSAWRRTPNSISLDVSIPVNCRAKVGIPKLGLSPKIVKEGDTIVWENGNYSDCSDEINNGVESEDRISFEIGSGDYAFKLTC